MSVTTVQLDGRTFDLALDAGFLTIAENGGSLGGLRVDPLPAPPATTYFVPDPEPAP